MTIAGQLEIELGCPSSGRTSARITMRRPPAVELLFKGRVPADVAGLVPTLFSVCRMAQAATAASACESVLGVLPSPGTARARKLLVLAESAREHLLRIVVDWPRFVGAGPEPAVLRRVMVLDRDLRSALDPDGAAFSIGGRSPVDAGALTDALGEFEALLQAEVFAEPANTWLARETRDDLAAWAEAAATPAQRLLHRGFGEGWWAEGAIEVDPLPEIDGPSLASRLLAEDADDFVRAPTWGGSPRETTPLVRQAGHPLVQACRDEAGFGLGARLLARLVELALLPRRIGEGAEALASDGSSLERAGEAPASRQAVAQTEAARGRLIHGIEVERGIVRRYRILAPTAWNFHPNGSAASSLAALGGAGAGEARWLAELMITALDPCISYELRVH